MVILCEVNQMYLWHLIWNKKNIKNYSWRMQYNRHNHQFTSEKLGKKKLYFHCMNMIIHELSRWYTTSKYTNWLTLFWKCSCVSLVC